MIWNGLELPEAYYQDDAVYIIHGDCREILSQLPKVDLVLTDPLYKDNDVDGEYYEWFKQWWEMLSFNDYAICFNNSVSLIVFLYGQRV